MDDTYLGPDFRAELYFPDGGVTLSKTIAVSVPFSEIGVANIGVSYDDTEFGSFTFTLDAHHIDALIATLSAARSVLG